MEEGDGLRTRSFKNEDYTNRRVFLRSYPLYFDNDEDHQQTTAKTEGNDHDKVGNGLGDACEFDHGDEKKKDNKKMKLKVKKEAIKKIIVTLVEWGDGRVVVLRRFKHKVSIYVVACFPIVFKPPKALISAR